MNICPIGNETEITKSFHIGYCTTDSDDNKFQDTAVCFFKSTLGCLQFIQFCPRFYVLNIIQTTLGQMFSQFLILYPYCLHVDFTWYTGDSHLELPCPVSGRVCWALNPERNGHLLHIGISKGNCKSPLRILLQCLFSAGETQRLNNSVISG